MAEMSELARRIVKRVAELPTPPRDDWPELGDPPEAMLVTGDELAELIDEEVAEVIDVEGDGLTQGERLINAVSFVPPSDPDVTKEEFVMTGEDGLTEGERRVVNACRIAIREELQRANCADAEPLGGFDDLADFLTPEEARKRFGELYTERGGVRTWREFQGLAGLWKPVFEYADDGINPMPGELRGYKLHVEPDAKPVDDYEGEAVQALSRGQEWPWETILDGVEHALGEGRFDKALRGRFGMSPKPKA
jgi:hypothetical protein